MLCLTCSQEVFGTDKYCSKKCQRFSKKKQIKCKLCGNLKLVRNDSKQLYCSVECVRNDPKIKDKKLRKWKKTILRKNVVCQICNKIFDGKGRVKYCSRKCWDKINNRRRCNDRRKRQQNKKKEILSEFGGKCILCGYNKCCRSLVFHHRDPKQKSFEISNINLRKPIKILIEEAKKCDLLCFNCHLTLHEKESLNNIDIKPKSLKQKERKNKLKKEIIEYAGGKCSKCGYKTEYNWCMTFHHINPDEKEFDLDRNHIYIERYRVKMFTELEKCVLLCANCHMEEEERLQNNRCSVS